MEFTRQTVKTVRDDLDAALATVAKKYGIDLSLGAIRFHPESFKVTLSATGGKAAGQPAEKRDKKDFEAWAGMFFLRPTDFGARFNHGGRSFTICGIKPRSRQYPVLGRDDRSGKVFKFSAADVLRALDRPADAKKADIGLDFRAERAFHNRHED